VPHHPSDFQLNSREGPQGAVRILLGALPGICHPMGGFHKGRGASLVTRSTPCPVLPMTHGLFHTRPGLQPKGRLKHNHRHHQRLRRTQASCRGLEILTWFFLCRQAPVTRSPTRPHGGMKMTSVMEEEEMEGEGEEEEEAGAPSPSPQSPYPYLDMTGMSEVIQGVSGTDVSESRDLLSLGE